MTDSLTAYARRHALIATLLIGVTALGLYAGRVAYTDSWLFLFLPRNLVLGWIPLGFAAAVVAADRWDAKWLALPLGIAWLLFLPNSVYLLTDLVHLRSRPGVPHVYDSTLCGAFAGAGILAGVSALSMVEEVVRRRFGATFTALALLPALFLNGLGVWIGRYQRWNSWDVLRDPVGIVRDVWTPMVDLSPHLWGITLTYAAVLGVSWLAVVSVRPRASAVRTHRVPPDPVATAR